MSPFFVKIYFFLAAIILLNRRSYYLAEGSDASSFLFFITLFAVVIVIFMCGRINTIFVSLLIIITLFMMRGDGLVSSKYIPLLFVSFLMLFYNTKKKMTSPYNFNLIRGMQFFVLSNYFCSGLWKIRNMIKSQSFNFFEIAREHMTYSLMAGSLKATELTYFIFNNIYISGLGLFCVMLFQISTIYPILQSRSMRVWGGLIVVFHLSTGIFLGIFFQEMLIMGAFVLIFAEYFVDIEKKLTQLDSHEK